jgi:signal transduction histidine kinase/ActR/RegA family two-component response regulator
MAVGSAFGAAWSRTLELRRRLGWRPTSRPCDAGAMGDRISPTPRKKAFFMKLGLRSIIEKMVLAFCCALAAGMIVTTVLVRLSLQDYTILLQKDLADRLMQTAGRATSLLTEEDLAALKGPEDMNGELFQRKRQEFIEFAEDNSVKFVYFLRYIGDQLQFVIDNDLDPETMVSLGQVTDPDSYVYAAFAGRRTATDMGTYAGVWDGLMSAYAPVFGANGQVVAVACVDISDEAMITAGRNTRYISGLMLAEMCTVIFAVAVLLVVYRRRARSFQEAYQSRTEFISMMSHEIRTPMNAIIGISEILTNDEHLSPSAKSYIRDIKTAGDALLNIINDILDLSKLEMGKMQLLSVDYNFHEFLDNIQSIANYLARDKGLNFKYKIQGLLPNYQKGDDVRLRQILLNIIGNAIKFTIKGSVTLRVKAEEKNIIFEIVDTGIGIKEEDLPHLFEPFKQLDEAHNRHIKGTGLGMSISRYLANLMGGAISAESVYGQGSLFRLVIPRIEGQKPVEALSPDNEPAMGKDVKVLVVDDNALNLTVASGLLRIHKIKSDTASSGFEALQMLADNDYHLVFMDQMMPEMDGLETTARIRALGGRYKELPIIALTANAMLGTRELLIKAGMNDFLSKPIKRQELAAILAKWVPEGEKFLDAGRTS